MDQQQPFRRADKENFGEEPLPSEMHNRSMNAHHFQGYFSKQGPRHRTNTQAVGRSSNDRNMIGAHLNDDNIGDNDMTDEHFGDEKFQALNAGGAHNHTQSVQIPQRSNVNFQQANGKLSRKASKGKLMGPSYQSNVSKPQQPSLSRKSTLTRQRSQNSYVAVPTKTSGLATTRNNQMPRSNQSSTAGLPRRQVTQPARHFESQNDAPMHNCSSHQILSHRSNNRSINASLTRKQTANGNRMVTRATAAVIGNDNEASARNLPLIQNNFQQEEAKIGELNPSVNAVEKIITTISNADLLAGNCMGGKLHPSRKLSRQNTTDEQRQNINVRHELSEDIDKYLRWLEETVDLTDCLGRHKVTANLRARMVDWMIEVLTNFRCDDQTFFLAVSLMDRYFKNCLTRKEVSDLHIIGVSSMFIASKFEDIYPLKMKTVFEKIAHKKLDISRIKDLELDMLSAIEYKIHAPTVLDFLKVYLAEVLNIEIVSRTETKKKEDLALLANNAQPQKEENKQDDDESKSETKEPPKPIDDKRTPAEKENDLQKYLIEKMAVYLAKMSMHEMSLAVRNPSLLAVGSIYVSLKICEQLRKKDLINSQVVERLIKVSRMGEEQILDVSQKVLHLAQNFDKEFPGLENLKKTHFGIITQLL